jgi:hypothetical protein
MKKIIISKAQLGDEQDLINAGVQDLSCFAN